jgi:hypothetical protein
LIRSLLLGAVGLLCALSWAQAVVEPPADALIPDQNRLRTSVAGHTFNWKPLDSGRTGPGVTSRMEFFAGGVVLANMSTGALESGTWSVEDGAKLCFKWQTSAKPGCNEVRIAGKTLWLRHDNGKWSNMTLVPKSGDETRKG